MTAIKPPGETHAEARTDLWISESEQTVAIRWPGDANWYRIDRSVVGDNSHRHRFSPRGTILSDYFRVGPEAWGMPLPDPGWTNPYREIDRLRAEVARLEAAIAGGGNSVER